MIKDFKNSFLHGIALCVFIVAGMQGFAQQDTEDKTDSIYAARLMQQNLELFSQVDSLTLLVKGFKNSNALQNREVDSLQKVITQLQADMAMARDKLYPGTKTTITPRPGIPAFRLQD